MRISLIPLALLLAACGSGQGEYTLEQEKTDFFEAGRASGYSDDFLEKSWQRSLERGDDPELQHQLAEKQEEIDALRIDQCRRHPHLEGC